MENTNVDLLTAEQIDQEIRTIASPENGGVRPRDLYRACQLIAKMRDLLQAQRGKNELLGFRSFSNWEQARRKSLGISHGTINNYANIGKYLLRYVSDEDLQKLASNAIPLADYAKRHKPDDSLIKDGQTMKFQEFKEKLALLQGKKSPLTNALRIKDHWTAVGALITVGNWLKYETYTAHREKQFRGDKLCVIATLNLEQVRGMFPLQSIESAKEIDVIWARDRCIKYFFEVEHSTRMKDAPGRMYQVLNLDADFVIVAPEKERQRFNRKMKEAPYRNKDVRRKYRFCSYDALAKLFKAQASAHQYYTEIFVSDSAQ